VRGFQSVSSGRFRSAWLSAFASSGERRAISNALSQRIAISAPPSGCTLTSSFGVGSEEPQSGQLRPLCCASRTARRLCSSESVIFAEQLLYIKMRRSPAALGGGFPRRISTPPRATGLLVNYSYPLRRSLNTARGFNHSRWCTEFQLLVAGSRKAQIRGVSDGPGTGISQKIACERGKEGCLRRGMPCMARIGDRI
jgi:hypothetical protein